MWLPINRRLPVQLLFMKRDRSKGMGSLRNYVRWAHPLWDALFFVSFGGTAHGVAVAVVVVVVVIVVIVVVVIVVIVVVVIVVIVVVVVVVVVIVVIVVVVVVVVVVVNAGWCNGSVHSITFILLSLGYGR
jgi:hypothetical protein